MKEKLIELLGLDEKATDADVIAEVSRLKTVAATKATADASEKEITTLIQKSGGALNREGAKMVIKNRKAAAAEQAKKK